MTVHLIYFSLFLSFIIWCSFIAIHPLISTEHNRAQVYIEWCPCISILWFYTNSWLSLFLVNTIIYHLIWRRWKLYIYNIINVFLRIKLFSNEQTFLFNLIIFFFFFSLFSGLKTQRILMNICTYRGCSLYHYPSYM